MLVSSVHRLGENNELFAERDNVEQQEEASLTFMVATVIIYVVPYNIVFIYMLLCYSIMY